MTEKILVHLESIIEERKNDPELVIFIQDLICLLLSISNNYEIYLCKCYSEDNTNKIQRSLDINGISLDFPIVEKNSEEFINFLPELEPKLYQYVEHDITKFILILEKCLAIYQGIENKASRLVVSNADDYLPVKEEFFPNKSLSIISIQDFISHSKHLEHLEASWRKELDDIESQMGSELDKEIDNDLQNQRDEDLQSLLRTLNIFTSVFRKLLGLAGEGDKDE